MVHKFLQDVRSFLSSPYRCALVFVWIVGTVAGSLCGFYFIPADDISASYTYILHGGAAFRFLVLAFPLVAAVVLDCFGCRFVLIFLAGIKSILYSFTVTHICIYFSHAGWLMLVLLMLADAVFTVVFVWFLLQKASYRQTLSLRNCIAPAVVCFSALFADVFLVCPILNALVYKL